MTRANHVWAMAITYIPLAKGFVYLVAVVDWYMRRVLAWRVSITMEVQFCLDAVEDALSRYGTLDMMNTDQGSHLTSGAFAGFIKAQGIRLSMDGRGGGRDNIFVKQLWRSMQHEEVFLHAYESISVARAGLTSYFQFYNTRRPRSSLEGQSLNRVHFQQPPQLQAA